MLSRLFGFMLMDNPVLKIRSVGMTAVVSIMRSFSWIGLQYIIDYVAGIYGIVEAV